MIEWWDVYHNGGPSLYARLKTRPLEDFKVRAMIQVYLSRYKVHFFERGMKTATRDARTPFSP